MAGGVKEHGVARGLGHAVAAGELTPQADRRLGEQLGGDRRGAVPDRAQGSRRHRVGCGIVEQHRQHGGRQAGHRGAEAAGEVPEQAGLEALGEDDRATGQVQRQHIVGRHVTQRERVQVGVGCADRAPEQRGGGAGEQRGMREHDPLGGAGGARRVDDPGRVVRATRGLVTGRSAGQTGRMVVEQLVDLGKSPAQRGRASLGQVVDDRVDQVVGADHQGGVDIGEHVGDLGGVQALVGERQHPSGTWHGAEGQRHRRVVVGQHRHAGAGGDLGAHPRRQRQRGPVPLGEGPAALSEGQGHRVGCVTRSGVELVAQQHGQARSGAGPAGREWSQSASSVRSAVSRLSGWSSIR